MKKLLFATFLSLSFIGFSQETNTWRLGVQWGFQGNRSVFSGGTPDANARFHQSKLSAGAFNIDARYDLNNHWMGTIGLGFNGFGFDYALANNYSLYNPRTHYSGIRSNFGALELPVMIYYKFNPNCKNAKWLVGGGFSQTFTGAQTITQASQVSNDGAIAPDNISSTSSTHGGMYTMLRLAVAREKVFKKGGILNAGILFNCGLRQLATSTVIIR